MGAQQSVEEAAETARQFHADIDARKEELEPEIRAEYAAMKVARTEHQKKELAAAAEMMKVALKKSELVRSSKSDVAVPKRTSRQPLIIDDDDADADVEPRQAPASSRASSAEVASEAGKKKGGSDVLKAWQPRKQPVSRNATIPDSEQESSEDEFTGFGNMISTQQAASTPTATAAANATKAQGGGGKKPVVAASTVTGNKVAKQADSGRVAQQNKSASTKQQVKSTPKAPVDFFKGAQEQQAAKIKPSATGTSKKAELPSKIKPTAPPAINTNPKLTTSAAPKAPAAPLRAAPALAAPAKRPAPSAFADERRASVQKPPKAPKRSDAASPQSPDGAGPSAASLGRIPKKKNTSTGPEAPTKLDATGVQERPPKWYNDLPKAQTRNPAESNADGLLQRLKADIKKCKDAGRLTIQRLYDSIGEVQHKIAFEPLSGSLLKKNRMLHDADGLPQIFDKKYSAGVSYPLYIQADAEELYNKWARYDFNTDLFRGIIPGKPGTKKNNFEDKVTDKIDPDYEGRVNPKYHSNGLLLNGQWWPTQLTSVRDGAHGASIAGIAGSEGEGAYSCIMSGGHEYPDEDNKDIVLYCGTDSNDGSCTGPTLRMLESQQTGKPVRLLRSHNLKSEWAPKEGFRYDGLYKVVSSENLDGASSQRQRHRFKLVRVPGQAPIRGGEGPDARPTVQEMDAAKKDKRMRGYT